VACDNGGVRINGVCTPVPTCTKPAVLQNNQCVPPANGATMVTFNALAWMGVEPRRHLGQRQRLLRQHPRSRA
jgi:hypothetical protein